MNSTTVGKRRHARPTRTHRRAPSPPAASPTPTANSDPKGGIPVVFLVHLAATLDNWDPRIIDPIAQTHHVIAFDNRGVGASSGTVPGTIEAMADDAYTFITALGFDTIDIFSFSLGGMVAQALVIKHPELVRKLILTGTGPAGGKDIDKVAGDNLLRHRPRNTHRRDPKEFLFFNRDEAGKRAGTAFVDRLKERTATGTRRSRSKPSRPSSRRSSGGDAPHPPTCRRSPSQR